MTTLLFQAVRDTLGTLLADPKYLGAQPGIIAALHTWSQTLVLHPHVHCLVTGGGLTPTGSGWRSATAFCCPARVVMAVFRGKMVAAIRQTLARGALALPEPMRPQQLLNLLNRLGHPTKTKWNVRIMERYRHGAGVVTYLARYLRGGPIKNARLVACDGDRVTFTYRARQEEADAGPASPQRMTLPVADFLQRWLLHVPVPQTRVVRCYGLYHPRTPRPWPSAARRLGNRRWRSRCAGLADGVCPAWGGPSRAVSHLWAAARVYGCHPAWRCAPAGAGWGARGMRPTHDRRRGRSVRGVVCLAVARWCPCAGRDAVWGAQRARSAHCCPTGEAVRACGRREGVGVTRPKLHSASEHPVSGRIRTRSVQPSAIRSAQGRA